MKKLIPSLGFAFASKASSLCKISYVIGSYCAWFSASAIVVPLAGPFVGAAGSSLVLLFRLLTHYMLFKTITLNFLAFCIPGYCASLYWATPNVLMRVMLPIGCMVLFIAHPVGAQAFPYVLYWLIPIALCVNRRNGLFFDALGSTFVAHAVGSVIWLYTVPTTASLWLGLIPVVAVERLLFAFSMVIAYKAIMFVKNTISKAIVSHKAYDFVAIEE